MNEEIYKKKYLKYKKKYNLLKKSFKIKILKGIFKPKKDSLLVKDDSSNQSNENLEIGDNVDNKIYSLELNKIINVNNISGIQIKISDTDYIIEKYYELLDNFYIPKVYDYNYLNLFKTKDGIDFIKLEKLFKFLNNEKIGKKMKIFLII